MPHSLIRRAIGAKQVNDAAHPKDMNPRGDPRKYRIVHNSTGEIRKFANAPTYLIRPLARVTAPS